MSCAVGAVLGKGGVAPRANGICRVASRDMAHYAWALWLAVPVAATIVGALWTWWRGRAAKPQSPADAIAAHRAYLDALTLRPTGAQSEPGNPTAR